MSAKRHETVKSRRAPRKRAEPPAPAAAAPDLSTAIGPLRLPNPVLVASGTFGGVVAKTVTLEPRFSFSTTN